MDRQIIYPGAIPLETDLLNTNKYGMVGLSKLAAAILGTSTMLNGLACVPDSPASLNVSVAPGEIYSLQNIDGTAYSSLAADTTHQIVKQGIRMDASLLSCPAPGTAGQSINYLIQVTYTDTDTDAVVLPYYNASNPAQAYSGPNNSGTAQNTVRKGVCTVAVKAGVAAATGSQTTPAPDAGYVGAWVVTVANGQTTINSGDIAQYSGAPFLSPSGLVVGGFQGAAFTSSAAGGTADALTGSFTPGITALTNGMTLFVRAASANATTTPTFTPATGTIAAKTIVKGAGAALAAGDIAGAGHWIALQYDLTLDKWVMLNPANGVATTSVASIQGAFKNLAASATGTNAAVTVSADEVAVEDVSNAYKTLRAVSLSIDSAASGANGLDTGTLAGSTWYSVWVIYNGTTTAGLISASATAPTMPSGYTHKARVGWIRTDGTANKYPLSFIQFGRRVQYKTAAGSNLTAYPTIASGVQGTFNSTTYTPVAVAWGAFAPPTSSQLQVMAYPTASAGLAVGLSPNANFSGFGTVTSPPIMSDVAGGGPVVVQGTIVPESSNIYYASNGAAAISQLIGWEDNL